ncbi:MAG TPA: DM13 domain-containing protein [Acidimicrobiia bacterium]|nr:DM13 domain-containing protein [Acidimicrobiia bacterium]
MTKKRLLIAAAVLAIPVLALAWWLGSPLFLDNEVSEEFPAPAAASSADTTVAGTATTEAMADEESMADDAMDDATATTSGSEGPTTLVTGEFEDADASHQGSGTATVFQLADGSQVLRLEEFEVTNGPDLHVVLVPTDGSMDGSVDLGSLKGNIGDQNYEIPTDVDIADFGSVWIYCVAFSVNFATAPLG